MKIKITKDNIPAFRRMVTRVTSLVNKDTAVHNEQCLLLQGASFGLSMTALESSSHKVVAEIPAEVEKEGELYINYAVLSRMTQNLRTDVGDLDIFLENNQLVFRYNLLGSIREGIYTGEAFKGIQFPVQMEAVINNSELLQQILSSLVVSKEFPTSLIRYSGNRISVYGQYGTTGYVRMSFPTGRKAVDPVNFFVKTSLLKSAAGLDDRLCLAYKVGPQTLRFTGDLNRLTVYCNSSPVKDFEVVDSLLEKEGVTTLVDYKGLSQALQWQSYKSGPADAIALTLNEDEFCIRGSGAAEAACVQASGGVDFKSIKIHSGSFSNALKIAYVKGVEMVSFKQVEVKGYKMLIISPEIELPYDLEVLQYEQLTQS